MPTYEQPKRVLANNLGEILMLEKFILQKVLSIVFTYQDHLFSPKTLVTIANMVICDILPPTPNKLKPQTLQIKELQSQGEKVNLDKAISKTFISVLKEFQEYLTRTQASLSANPTSNTFNLYYEVCVFNHLSVCLFVRLPVCMFVCLFVRTFACLYVLFVCIFVYLFVSFTCLFVCSLICFSYAILNSQYIRHKFKFTFTHTALGLVQQLSLA